MLNLAFYRYNCSSVIINIHLLSHNCHSGLSVHPLTAALQTCISVIVFLLLLLFGKDIIIPKLQVIYMVFICIDSLSILINLPNSIHKMKSLGEIDDAWTNFNRNENNLEYNLNLLTLNFTSSLCFSTESSH